MPLPSREELEKIIKDEGFELSNEKFRITKLGQAHYVTGLSVSDINNGPHVPRRMKRRLREELYFCRKYGIVGHLSRIGEPTIQSGVNRLNGYVHYVAHIEAAISQRLNLIGKSFSREMAASQVTIRSIPMSPVTSFAMWTKVKFLSATKRI